MRICSCFGVSTDDINDWPYSLRVCEMCIADDATTGRIRCCGICGVVACDENCGEEMVECTDDPEWKNAGELKKNSVYLMGIFYDFICFRTI